MKGTTTRAGNTRKCPTRSSQSSAGEENVVGKETKKAEKPPKGNASAEKKRVKFSIQSDPGSKVAVAGSFNDWDAEANLLKDKNGTGTYTGTLLIVSGVHEYKFVIDGTWHVDPACSEWVQNGHGTLNSLLRV